MLPGPQVRRSASRKHPFPQMPVSPSQATRTMSYDSFNLGQIGREYAHVALLRSQAWRQTFETQVSAGDFLLGPLTSYTPRTKLMNKAPNYCRKGYIPISTILFFDTGLHEQRLAYPWPWIRQDRNRSTSFREKRRVEAYYSIVRPSVPTNPGRNAVRTAWEISRDAT